VLGLTGLVSRCRVLGVRVTRMQVSNRTRPVGLTGAARELVRGTFRTRAGAGVAGAHARWQEQRRKSQEVKEGSHDVIPAREEFFRQPYRGCRKMSTRVRLPAVIARRADGLGVNISGAPRGPSGVRK
jgi:hypothetical protein